MDPDGGSAGSSYYAVLEIGRDASFSDVRSAYRKLALKWHPDRWAANPAVAADAKQRFQKIQEAYSVLSDASKKSAYDAGLYDPLEEDQVRTRQSQKPQKKKKVLSARPKPATMSFIISLIGRSENGAVFAEGSSDFMQELVSMMNSVRNERSYSLEDLQKMFVEMVGGDVFSFDHGGNQTASKRAL